MLTNTITLVSLSIRNSTCLNFDGPQAFAYLDHLLITLQTKMNRIDIIADLTEYHITSLTYSNKCISVLDTRFDLLSEVSRV